MVSQSMDPCVYCPRMVSMSAGSKEADLVRSMVILPNLILDSRRDMLGGGGAGSETLVIRCCYQQEHC